MATPGTAQHRVRKRAPNACNRCRQQKIRCSGSVPCEQCSKRSLACQFDDKQQKILVTRGFLEHLERRATRNGLVQSSLTPGCAFEVDDDAHEEPHSTARRGPAASTSPMGSDLSSDSEEPDPDPSSAEANRNLTNPLVSGNPSYTADTTGKPFYLGTSSNWAFVRRILVMVHERVFNNPLPAMSLLFPYGTYDIGWDGRRTSAGSPGIALPTADFALFLINAVKFHCGQLYHVFDEAVFMDGFKRFHDGPHGRGEVSDLWYIHYLLILAFGKAFIVRMGNGRQPPGAEFFVEAMKILPDITFLCTEPIQAIEILCSAALYLQCIDFRSAAYNLIGQAMRIALEQGLHTDIQSHHRPDCDMERCREVWWTVYVLDRQMSSLMGVPMALEDEDITSRLPTFAGSERRSQALGLHVKLSQVTARVLQTVYGRDGRADQRFIFSMKRALKSLAEVNDERNNAFPLDPKQPLGGLSRLSAYLHLFHHQCIILTTRPLLFSFWQRRLETSAPFRVRSSGGARSLLRVCIQSAQHTVDILAALHAQSLLESFLPFDLESGFSAAVVLILAPIVDPTLTREKNVCPQAAYTVLGEMASRGNMIAGLRKAELEQLDSTLQKLSSMPGHDPMRASQPEPGAGVLDPSPHSEGYSIGTDLGPLQGWSPNELLSGEQLMAVADSLDFNDLDWISAGLMDPTAPSLP